MSSPAASASVTPTGQASAAANQAAATAANQAATTEVISGTLSSMADLQQQAPEVYTAMMQGIAMIICNQMQTDEAQLEQMEEEFREEDEES